MTETPDHEPTEPAEDQKARDSLAGDLAKTLDPDVEDLDEGRVSAERRTGD